MQFLYFIQQALIWIITIYWIYQLIISVCSLITLKEKPLIVNKNHKFLAIIPAHNEEAVVGNLIESLQKQNYPKNKYDICVIADNCTDKTKEVAESYGVKIFERYEEDPAKRTKGDALRLFLNTLLADPNMDYDAFCVFDADNIVDANFISAMNKHLCQGEEVVQGYRDIKNPTDSWIASGYAIFYWTMNRFYHLARYNAGFSLKRIIQGKKLGWATDAIVYDEQPVKFKPSWSQRSRWTIGHIQCLQEYTKPLAKAASTNKTLMNFDGLLYMLGSIPMFVITILLLVLNAISYLFNGMTTPDFVMNIVRYVVPTFLLPILTALIIMIIDKKPIKKMWKGLLMYPIFLGSWLLINFKCLFKRDTTWEKIEHVRNVKIEDKKISQS